MSRLTLTLGNASIEVKIGDIFECAIFNDDKVIKVIPFNQYFDTQLDDNIVVKSSVNGQFLKKIFNCTCAEHSTDHWRSQQRRMTLMPVLSVMNG
ncbi:macro domain-containing protein [Periweissella fabalis]|uniref:macro domain-containing protein n=1 Tax=Periweissella fabalis TaxID=1070421 RepID=UPI003B84819E